MRIDWGEHLLLIHHTQSPLEVLWAGVRDTDDGPKISCHAQFGYYGIFSCTEGEKPIERLAQQGEQWHVTRDGEILKRDKTSMLTSEKRDNPLLVTGGHIELCFLNNSTFIAFCTHSADNAWTDQGVWLPTGQFEKAGHRRNNPNENIILENGPLRVSVVTYKGDPSMMTVFAPGMSRPVELPFYGYLCSLQLVPVDDREFHIMSWKKDGNCLYLLRWVVKI